MNGRFHRLAARLQRCTEGERGESLIEVLATMMIMGLVIAALVTGFETSLFASSTYSDSAREETVLTTYVESLKANVATLCPSVGTPLYAPGPTDSNGYRASITSAQYWDPTARQFQATCNTTTIKLQEVVVKASGPRAASQQVTVILGTRT